MERRVQRPVHGWWKGGVLAITTMLAAGCVRTPAPSADSPGGAPPPASPAVDVSRPDSSVAIELRTDRSSYRAGDKATLTIVNHTKREWSFNPCTRTLERETATGWQVVPEGRMCTMEAWVLGAQATRTAPTSFGASLDTGRYRLVIGFASAAPPASGSTRATSAPVTITK